MKTSILICLATAISVQAQNFTDFPCSADSRRVAIIGGGAAAVAAAEPAQANGWQAIIVDPRNHVAGMMAASNHSWLLNGSTGESVPRPEGTVKKELFARVMDSGAYPLLLSHCAGLLVMDNRITGVAIASKFGTFIMEADAVIDASEEQIAAKHLLGLPQKWTQTAEINFELSNAHAFTTNKLPLPDGVVTTHRTIKDGVLCISAHKSVECDASDWLAPSRLEMEMREWAVRMTAQIRKHIINMQDVALNRFGELRILTEERELPATEGLLRIPAQLPLEATTNDLRKLESNAARLTEKFLQNIPRKQTEGTPVLHSSGKALPYSPSAHDASKLLQPVVITPSESTDIEVLVAGGGTGGSAVMTALAHHKTPALTVDILPFLGGTTTGGGVSGAWHGFQKGAYAAYCKNRDQLGREEHLVRFCASVRLWDKMFLSQETKQQFLGQAVVCGAMQQDHKITSALVYSANGFRAINAKLFIDATGDADLCAHAGIPTKLGDDKGWIQSSSCWGIDDWGMNGNFQNNHYGNDFDVVDPTDYADTIRGLMLAHRHNGDYHLSPIYTQRESRRIIGNYYLTLNDILTRKFRTDAIAVASCLFDSHGRITSELIKRYLSADAYNPTDKEIHVLLPLGTFVPAGMTNLLVAAKAISGERDATSLCRMNPDITNAGYAIGTVASQFIERNLAKTDDVDLDRIRLEMKEIGVLPDWAFTPAEPEWTVDFAAKRLDSPGGFMPALFMPPEQIIPVLKKRLEDGAPEPDMTALLLAWFGCADGQARLIRKFNVHAKQDMAKLEDKGPDGYIITDVNGKTFEGNERTNYGYPQVGKFLPGRAYGVLNRMITTMSYIDTPETLELVLPLLERAWAGSDTLRTGTTPYAIARRDCSVPYFHERLWALAVFFRNRPTPRAIPALERLLQQKYLGGNIMHESWGDNPYFQLTYLEIMLADALHRCGGESGTKRLQEFTTDSRAIFRNMAIRCLNAKKD